MHKLFLSLSVAALVATPVIAVGQASALPVAFDSGKGVPMGPYISYMIAGDDVPEVSPLVRFPLSSPLRSGHLSGQRRILAISPQWMTSPVALIGSDDVSRKWLSRNADALQKMQGFVIVVSAPSASAFKSLQRDYPSLALAPSLSPWLEKTLLKAGVSTYPVLINAAGFAKQDLGGAR